MRPSATLQFVIGPAGSGKTRWCFDAIERELRARPIGPPVWLVTLRQATLELSRAFMLASGLPAVSRLRVVSFDKLRSDILAECGGNALPQLDATGRRLLMAHLLRRHRDTLTFFGPVATRPGTADEICGLLDELDRAGQTVDDLAEVIRSSDEPALADPALRRKADDLVTLGRAYRTALSERIDPKARQQAALDAVPHCMLLDRCHVYVDGFWDFDLPDRRLLAAIGNHASTMAVTATVIGEREQPATLRRISESFARIRATLDPDRRADVKVLRNRNVPGGLRQIADRLLHADAPTAVVDGVSFFEAADRRAEVREVAATIRSELRNGLRQRACAVLVRDLDTYGTLIHEVFADHGLTYFADQRRPAGHHPLIRMVRNLLRVAAEDWPFDATIGLIKTGLAGISTGDAERLERYTTLHRLRGSSAWTDDADWQFRRRANRDDDEADELLPDESPAMDRLRRRLAGNIRPLHAVLSRERFTVAEAVRALFDVIDAFDTSAVMARQIDEHRLADDEEQAAELEQVWQGLCDLLDQYVELLGDDETTREDFVADLLAGFETIDLAIVPPTVDAVLVGEIERVRGGGFGFVAVMGLSETVFPAQPAEPVLISDAQRRALSMSDLELQRDGERRLLDERYLLYHAVTRSAKSLLVTRPRRSEASSLAPSLFWSELRSAVPAALVRDTPTGPTTSRELAARIADWAHGETDDEAARWRAALPADGDAVWHATRAAFDYDNRPKLPADVATALFGASFDGSISRLEARALCAFRHFAEYGLQLVVEESDELTARDIGNLLHRAIELVVGGLIETGHDFGGDDPGDLDARVMEAVEAVAARLRGRIWMSAGRNRYERDRLGRELLAAVRRQLAFLRGGDFRPAAVEVPFGEDDPDWPAPSGDGFTLRGRIDRFDRSPAGLASVIDYKTNQRLFNAADVADGVGLQLPVYLLAADAAGHRPAGAFFVQLRRPMQRVRHPSEIADRPLEPKPRGVFDANLIRHFDRDADATSERLQYRMSKRSGTLHKSDIDPLTGDRLVRLLEVSRQVVTEVARLAVSPDITPRPWRRGTRTDSAGAAFAAVSRHEPRRNGYRLSTNVSLPELLGEVDDG